MVEDARAAGQCRRKAERFGDFLSGEQAVIVAGVDVEAEDPRPRCDAVRALAVGRSGDDARDQRAVTPGVAAAEAVAIVVYGRIAAPAVREGVEARQHPAREFGILRVHPVIDDDDRHAVAGIAAPVRLLDAAQRMAPVGGEIGGAGVVGGWRRNLALDHGRGFGEAGDDIGPAAPAATASAEHADHQERSRASSYRHSPGSSCRDEGSVPYPSVQPQ